MFLYLISSGCALLGFFIASYVRHKKTTQTHMVCPLRSNCQAVIQSQYSRFLGVPIELMGMFYYAFASVGYLLFFLNGDTVVTWFGQLVLALTAAAAFFSVYLIAIQTFALRQFCTWCLASAALSITIALLSAFSSWPLVDRFFESIGAYAALIPILYLVAMAVGLALGLTASFGLPMVIVNAESALASPDFLLQLGLFVIVALLTLTIFVVMLPRIFQISTGQEHEHAEGELHTLRKMVYAFGCVLVVTWLVFFILPHLPVALSFQQGVIAYLVLVALSIGGSQALEHGLT
ncbi:MAG: Vitamin K epoxide reductase [Parcubacteria group bacterium GW2011_GWA2_56_7]|nr:MAG: Vitamin K epoxide reductase [Parcubacteria group bacterium GW2011_GWA2_56_7]